MRRSGSIILCLCLIVSACTHHKRPVVPKEEPPKVVKKASHVVTAKHQVNKFHFIKLQGQIDVKVRSGFSKPMVILRGDPRDLQQVITQSHGDTLLVSLGKGYPKYGPVRAEVRGRYINGIAYQGHGNLSAPNLKSNDLVLDLNNSGVTNINGYIMLSKARFTGNGLYTISGVHSDDIKIVMDGRARVDMKGEASVHNLQVNGDGKFRFHWIKGAWLRLRAGGRSQIQLAGIVDKLDVELTDQAKFEGRYLRADRAFVKTDDESIARISAVLRQHTLARGRSDIYFYNLSQMRTDFMADDGSVLDMRSWSLRAIDEYSEWNKWL